VPHPCKRGAYALVVNILCVHLDDLAADMRSGFSIAMGIAPDQVKVQASATTESYNDEGFAKAMERFILGLLN
jgi:haloacid dehalogenase-like hydrolase